MRGGLGSSSTIWTGTRYELKISRYCGKSLITTFVENPGGILVGGGGGFAPILNRI